MFIDEIGRTDPMRCEMQETHLKGQKQKGPRHAGYGGEKGDHKGRIGG